MEGQSKLTGALGKLKVSGNSFVFPFVAERKVFKAKGVGLSLTEENPSRALRGR